MKLIFKSIYRCLNQKLKIQLFILIIFSFIIPFLELIGLAAIIPVIQISLNEVSFAEYGMLYSFVGLFADELDKSYFVYVLILLIFSFFLFKTFFLIFCENFRLKYIKSLQDIFSIKLYNTYIFSNYEDFSNFQFTEKNRNIGIVPSLTDYIKNCNQILVETLFFIFIFIFLLKYSFTISLIAFCIFFIVSVVIYLLSKTKLLQYSSIRFTATANIVRNLLNVFYSLKEVIILKRRGLFKEQFKKSYSSMTDANYKDSLIKFIPRNILELTVISVVLIIISYMVFTGSSISENLELLGVFTFAMLKISLSANKLLLAFQDLKSIKIPASEVSKELLQHSKIQDFSIDKNENIENKLNFNKSISLKDVNFIYSGTSKKVLENINIKIEKYKTIGISGPSGSGKTTLINLILGFLKPTSGKVFLDNFDIHTDVKSWHNSIAYVPQDIFLFNDSIKNNILFGIDEKKFDIKEINRVLKIVNLDEFISKLGEGLDTIVGEKGAKLSGGQAQRINIARSILLDKDIIFLDEATSKLDESNEFEIIENVINKLGGKKTIIIISHRVKTLETFCDEIYTM
jgi:ATP-binding cassette, subfamily B, bacterial PglK